ncbi:dihydroxyacetone kinase [candidate division KSB3 bacterium]|uniref:Dihydroxyacetone kinase n=1 Tax=candidate division KSB3 bacterium TaxID=2044937 RepID=A0A2G6KGI6_9BACT|nr:MAG: dihydroxyacetone kinase [candidate division KSB3 bacterium]
MQPVKKIINNPKHVVTELLEGMVEAYHGQIKPLSSVQALVKTDIPRGKVALLIGGGSGHEPVFHGFIGDNMADGAACGNIFAAPTPNVIFEVTQALNQGKGVLYLYGNYAGDNMNFDIAAEMAEDENIEVKTVRVWDDVASAPPERADERRGIAGDLFMIKIAGGAAATLESLDEVYRVAVKARNNLRSMGVAVSAGAIPETGEPTFELPDDEIEIGMGLHGEPGVSREKLLPADRLVENMMEKILADLPFQNGDEVVLLVNDLGATTMMELLIVNRKVRQILREQGIAVYDTILGSFCTCQEMAGFSISLMKLDEELKKYYDMPASSLGYSKSL